MKFCRRCGKQLRDSTKFCRYCGEKTGIDVGAEQFAHNINGVKPDAATDGGFGTFDYRINSFEKKEEKPQSRKALYICGAVALVIMMIVIIVLVAVLNDRNATDHDSNYDHSYSDDYNSGHDHDDDYDYDDDDYDEYDREPHYQVIKEDITWSDACDDAYQHGGELACIHSYDEFEEICDLADQRGLKVIWVGAYREDYETWDDVYWIDGSKMTFTQWYDGEPTYNYDGEEEQYLMIFKVGKKWYFNDSGNDVSYPEYHYQGKIGYAISYDD